MTSNLEPTLSHYAFPSQHRQRLRSNESLECLVRQMRKRSRIVGAVPHGHPALMMLSARLRAKFRIVTDTRGHTRRYLDMSKLDELDRMRSETDPPRPLVALGNSA